METHYSRIQTAGLIRKALKDVFPDTTFSVSTKQYTGGSSITISYANGPLTKDVEAVVKPFEGASFDGFSDSTHFNKARLFRGEMVSFNYGFVFVQRTVTDELMQVAAYRAHKETKLPLLTFKDGGFIDGEYPVPFSYSQELDTILHGPTQGCAGGEWYSQLVHQISWGTATPHKHGETELPQLVDALLSELVPDSSTTVH